MCAHCAITSSGILPVLASVPDTPPVATIFPMRDTAGIGLAWPSPSTSNDFLLLMSAHFSQFRAQYPRMTTRFNRKTFLISSGHRLLAGRNLIILGQPMKTILAVPSRRRRAEFLDAVVQSRKLHADWVSPPGTSEAFNQYLKRFDSPSHVSSWILTEADELEGGVKIKEIFCVLFLSCSLRFFWFG